MTAAPAIVAGRIRRMREELAEAGFEPEGADGWADLLVVEVDYAMRPAVHERRVPTFGSIIEPTQPPEQWEQASQLAISRRSLGGYPVDEARRFADGLSSFLLRHVGGDDEFVVFDRAAGSERDLVVLAEAMGATVVQRHPLGYIRVVGAFGVLRWDDLRWHFERPISSWVDSVSACGAHGDKDILFRLLTFAVHDLGARGTGAVLVYQPHTVPEPFYEIRHPPPPPLQISHAADLAPLRHVLGQIDGAAVFDETGTLRELGVRLVPSAEAESDIEGLRGMRHTSARRYSFDESASTLIVVSEDGPVTVVRNGDVLGSSGFGWIRADSVPAGVEP